MRKIMIILGCLSLGVAQAQQGRNHIQHTDATRRMGVNTDKPMATLELRKVSDVPATQVQGFLLPHLTQEERNAFTKEALVNGLMIFNTTKNCIDWWDGSNWKCTDGGKLDSHGDIYTPHRSVFGRCEELMNAATNFVIVDKNLVDISPDGTFNSYVQYKANTLSQTDLSNKLKSLNLPRGTYETYTFSDPKAGTREGIAASFAGGVITDGDEVYWDYTSGRGLLGYSFRNTFETTKHYMNEVKPGIDWESNSHIWDLSTYGAQKGGVSCSFVVN